MPSVYEFGSPLESTSVASVHAGSRSGPHGFAKPVTLTVVHSELAREREFSRAFVEASSCFARVADRRVLVIDDVVDEKGRLFSVSPPMDGASLSRLIDCPSSRARAVSPAFACHIALSVAEAVAHVGAALPKRAPLGGVSAQATWITSRGSVVLMHTALCARNVPARCRRPDLSRFRAPELDRGKSVGPAADVYSIGVLLWDLLSHGRAPAPDLDAATRAVGTVIDPGVVRLVMRCLSPAPQDRPSDASEFGAELSEYVEHLSSIDGGEVARAVRDAVDPRVAAAQRWNRERQNDTIEIRTSDLQCFGPLTPYDVAKPPVRHVSDFAKSARPPIPRPRQKRRGGLQLGVPNEQRSLSPRLVRPDGTAMRLEGKSGRWVVGRSGSADVVALDPDMSRQHFEVLWEADGAFRVRDLGSKNGLFVNGFRARNSPLRSGDELRAGGTVLRFEV